MASDPVSRQTKAVATAYTREDTPEEDEDEPDDDQPEEGDDQREGDEDVSLPIEMIGHTHTATHLARTFPRAR